MDQDEFRILLLFFSFFVDLLSSTPTNGTKEINPVINARQLYKSCMNESNIEVDGVEPILEIINNEFGGWPILDGPSWNSSNFNLTNLLLKLRQYDDGIFFSVTTATNQENSSIYDIEVNRRRGFFSLNSMMYHLARSRNTRSSGK